MEKKIKIFIADDHLLMRQGLIAMLEKTTYFEICGEAANGKELLDLIVSNSPDVVILDLQMPVMDGYTVLPILKRDHPDVKVIVLTEHDDEKLTQHLLAKDAHAYLLKSCEHEDLILCIEKVCEGIYSPEDSSRANSKATIRSNFTTRVRFSELSLREIAVLREFCTGKTHGQIAESLIITIQTLKFHFQNIYAKQG